MAKTSLTHGHACACRAQLASRLFSDSCRTGTERGHCRDCLRPRSERGTKSVFPESYVCPGYPFGCRGRMARGLYDWPANKDHCFRIIPIRPSPVRMDNLDTICAALQKGWPMAAWFRYCERLPARPIRFYSSPTVPMSILIASGEVQPSTVNCNHHP